MFCFCSDNKLRYRNVCAFVSISLIYFLNLYFSNTVPVTKTLWYTYVQENSPLHTTTNTLCLCGVWVARGLQGDVVYLCWPIAPSNFESKCGGRGGGLRGLRLSAYECSSAHHVICSPNKLRRPSSIFNLNVVERKFCRMEIGNKV